MENTKIYDELRWIEDDPSCPRPPPGEFSDMQTISYVERVLNKCKQNLLVPIGLGATTTCLLLGLRSMTRGDSQKQQVFMRGRVLFQALTLVAMFITVAATGRSIKSSDKEK